MLAFSVKHDALLILTEAAKSLCCAAAHHSDFTFCGSGCDDANLPEKKKKNGALVPNFSSGSVIKRNPRRCDFRAGLRRKWMASISAACALTPSRLIRSQWMMYSSLSFSTAPTLPASNVSLANGRAALWSEPSELPPKWFRAKLENGSKMAHLVAVGDVGESKINPPPPPICENQNWQGNSYLIHEANLI